MKKACLALVFVTGLTVSGPASAADNTIVGVGTGAVAGAVVAGPVGAVVGAVAGGFIGANSERPRYRRSHRARAAYRRRYGEAAPQPHQRLAFKAPQSRGAVRPVSTTQPVPPARPVGSEITTEPAARSNDGAVWSEPN